ncbi:DUF881 domain-containing protein [Terracoccus luteus]|uniref:Uncharacterized protein YlxW (UPF0749 family) n=1 Tax=Terracoccus luteus TaxID=53356 RepID=A0A839PUT9_9MICO|nr:DUF881 domain-containing protein [Terracoccus luteus]MBB2987287.1 uncharacterized protein YlxW (UPF0749 family) [Terracoccus luteus]MCP2172938.1 uncharacterized protein YlxW (UPF0749 family) [Terracoccus luteus]
MTQVEGEEMTRGARHRRRRARPLWTVLVPVVTAGAGLMFAMSFQAAQGSDLRADRDLPQLIVAGDARVEQRAQQLDALRREVDALTKADAPTDTRLAGLTSTAERLASTAGTTAVSGTGIEVTLDDSNRSLDSLPGFTGDDVVVHQQDVQGVVNALWRGGAEAMMIQDQRVVSTSAVRCVGNTLILQGRVYAPPYTIRAIGDVGAMQRSLDTDPTVALYQQYVEAVGLGYDVQTPGTVDLPAYSGSVDLQHATPLS